MLSLATKVPDPASTCPHSALKMQLPVSAVAPTSFLGSVLLYDRRSDCGSRLVRTLFRPLPGTLSGSTCSRKPLMPLPHEPAERFEAASYPDRLMGDVRWAEKR